MGARRTFIGAVAIIASSATAYAQSPIDRGQPRNDLERFVGVYRDLAEAEHRQWFVAEARPPVGSDMEIPNGYLMIGAMWGDVAPWYMNNEGEFLFVYPSSNEWNPEVVIEFEMDAGGNAAAFTMTRGEEAPQRLERVGDLPPDW